MANPTSLDFTFAPEGTFTFSNGHTTITAQTDILPPPAPFPPESVTVEAVTIEASHHTVILPVDDVVVPPPVVEHVFDLLFPHT
jgi:hypothetical protein